MAPWSMEDVTTISGKGPCPHEILVKWLIAIN